MPELEPEDLIDELASLPTIAHPVVDPAGERIALYYDRTGRNELQVFDLVSGHLEQWSNGEVPRNARWYLVWDDTGDRVIFHRDEEGNEQNDLFALAPDGTVTPLVEEPGQAVLFDVTEAFVFFGSTRDGQLNAYRLNRSAGSITKLTEYERAVGSLRVAPTGEWITYTTNESEDYHNKDVYLAEPDGSNPHALDVGEDGAETTSGRWAPDGSRLLIADNSTDLGRIGVYHLESESIDWVGNEAFEESPVAFVPDRERVIGTRQLEARTEPIVIDLDSGTATALDLPEGVVSFAHSSGRVFLHDGRLLLTLTTPTRRRELLAYDLDTHAVERLLEEEYGPFEPDDFVDASYFEVPSNGVPETPAQAVELDPATELTIEALLYDSGARPSPLVVKPHGGPRARDSMAFSSFDQLLGLLGYSVLKVNYRGSSGRGQAFAEELLDDWGGAEQGDIAVAAEQALAANAWLDPDAVAVFGGSYGGYSAYWQLLQYPKLYAAGIAWIGVSDLEGLYEETMPHFRSELLDKYLGAPEESPDLYEERSPLTYAEQLEVPLLIAHGINDRRVPISQARAFKQALVAAGFEEGKDGQFEYLELGEEGHGSTDQVQKQRMFEALADFLDRRLGAATDD